MKTLKSRIILGVTALLALVLVSGGLSVTGAYAQGPGQGANPPIATLNNQAVLDLLKSTETELLQLRQSGKTWVEIATAKGVTETALLDALLQPIIERHAQMSAVYPMFNAAQMTEYMRTQFTTDIRVTQFGTMTDRHVFGVVGMMGNYGFGGMMGGRGMMGNWNNNGFGGMMRGRGMMGNWNNWPNVTPVPAQ